MFETAVEIIEFLIEDDRNSVVHKEEHNSIRFLNGCFFQDGNITRPDFSVPSNWSQVDRGPRESGVKTLNRKEIKIRRGERTASIHSVNGEFTGCDYVLNTTALGGKYSIEDWKFLNDISSRIIDRYDS